MNNPLLDSLKACVTERQERKAVIAENEELIKEGLDLAIGVLLAQLDLKSTTVKTDDNRLWSVYVVESPGRVTLDRTKLLLAGVTNEQLKRGESMSKPETH